MIFSRAERYSERTRSNMETGAAIQKPAQSEASPCLCVDLDGTLVQGDTLVESLIVLLRTQPWRILGLVFGSSGGKRDLSKSLGD